MYVCEEFCVSFLVLFFFLYALQCTMHVIVHVKCTYVYVINTKEAGKGK